MIFDQKEIRIEELPGFNLIELMEEANNKMMPEFQETWKFPYRVWNQNKQELDHREEDERGIEIPMINIFQRDLMAIVAVITSAEGTHAPITMWLLHWMYK